MGDGQCARHSRGHITVTNPNDGEPGSLREAIAAANDGDTINFDAFVHGITLLFGELVVDKRVTISGPDAKTFEVNAYDRSRVFHITNGVTVSISGLIIVNGQADERGGGILNDHSTLTVSNCTIYNNNVGYDLGGGSCNDGSFGSANEINNSTDIRGGGIYKWLPIALVRRPTKHVFPVFMVGVAVGDSRDDFGR